MIGSIIRINNKFDIDLGYGFQGYLSDMVIQEHSKLNELVDNKINFTDIKREKSFIKSRKSFLRIINVTLKEARKVLKIRRRKRVNNELNFK